MISRLCPRCQVHFHFERPSSFTSCSRGTLLACFSLKQNKIIVNECPINSTGFRESKECGHSAVPRAEKQQQETFYYKAIQNKKDKDDLPKYRKCRLILTNWVGETGLLGSAFAFKNWTMCATKMVPWSLLVSLYPSIVRLSLFLRESRWVKEPELLVRVLLYSCSVPTCSCFNALQLTLLLLSLPGDGQDHHHEQL